MKAALVNKNTEIVENVIMVNSLNDIVPEDYTLVGIDLIENISEEELQTILILQELDSTLVIEKEWIERPVHIGKTKWNQTQGFYEE